MKDIEIGIPADVLRSLLEGKQANYPYIINDGNEPLRITIYVRQSESPRKFRRT